MHQVTAQADELKSILVGAFYSRFAIGDSFDFYFDDFVLSAREIRSKDETSINAVFVGDYPPARLTSMPECIAKSVVAASCLGAAVSSAELLSDSSLLLTFSNGVEIVMPTDTPIVDWHWAITDEGDDPYTGCVIACFAPGDVQGGMPDKSLKLNLLRDSA